MTRYMGMLALTAMVTFGSAAATVYAADAMSDQDHMEKQQQQDLQKESELGLKGNSSDGADSKKGERQLGAGSLGEDSKGGAGPSGTKGLPPGQAPGFEGANKEPGRGPTSGGH